MTLADRIYEVTKQLPDSALTELLDFAEFLEQKKLRVVEQTTEQVPVDAQRGNVARTLALLASPRFAHRPKASHTEVTQRISALRDGWDGR